jgi:Ca-activated chloride channel homolog
LATSVSRLLKSKAKSKVVILLSDGKEQAPKTRLIDPLTALSIAKTKGVKVYTIGLAARSVPGMEDKYPVPDEPLMQKISSETGGKYYRATSAAVLQGIYQQIDKLEKSKVDVITKTNIHELFHWFVLAALFFLLLELLLKYTLLRTFP